MDIEVLEGKMILITGATGLIGSSIIGCLTDGNGAGKNSVRIIGLGRNEKKAEKMLANNPNVRFVKADVSQPIEIDEPIDYIVHAAAQTSSKSFVNSPVETINVAVQGTLNVLELARKKSVSSFVFLSTMEVYGTPMTDEKIDEKHGTNLDTMAVRSSYPESKRLCENICTAYCKEYGIPIKVVRLTQTFGPGVDYDDGRVFAEFARCVIEGKDIVLHTKGETRRNYLYSADAAEAILTVMLRGKNGEAYNAANEDTYCSIAQMAEKVANVCAHGKIKVKFELDDGIERGYAPALRMNLDTKKIRALGWKPRYGLEEMFLNLIEDLRTKFETKNGGI